MNTDQLQDQAADVDEAGDAGPQIAVTIDDREWSLEEIAELVTKPVDQLTDDEQRALKAVRERAEPDGEDEPQGVDAMGIVSDLIQDCLSSLLSKPIAAQRLEHKIALAQAMATMVQAQATRHLAMLTQRQLQLVMLAQQQQAEVVANRVAGPAAIHIPTGPVVRLRG